MCHKSSIILMWTADEIYKFYSDVGKCSCIYMVHPEKSNQEQCLNFLFSLVLQSQTRNPLKQHIPKGKLKWLIIPDSVFPLGESKEFHNSETFFVSILES